MCRTVALLTMLISPSVTFADDKPTPLVLHAFLEARETARPAKPIAQHAQLGPNGWQPARPQAPSGATISPQTTPTDRAVSDLDELVAQLKAERESLESLQDAAIVEPELDDSPTATQTEQLRQQLAQLLSEFAKRRKEEKTAADSKPNCGQASNILATRAAKRPDGMEQPAEDKTTAAKPADFATGKPVDPLALAQALFRVSDFDAAIQAFGLIEPSSLKADDRVAVKYLTATCLRKLGRVPEALPLYREVANSKTDEFYADCARWQLRAIDWRHQFQTRFEQLCERRRTLQERAHPAPALARGE
jgi:tetratricopeptide (TPR) repeat protein